MKRILVEIVVILFAAMQSTVFAGGILTSGETRSAGIAGPTYMDTWSFSGIAGERIVVYAVKTNGALDTTISLYPPGGGPVEASGWKTGYGGDTLDWQLRTNGTYTILISDYGLSEAGQYVISFLKIPGPVNSLADPDGGVIVSGSNNRGTINLSSDLDAYQFQGDAGDRIIINAVTTNGAVDTTIQLYPPGGGPVEAAGWMTGYGGDQLDHQLAKKGLYTIVIADYGLDHTGDFNITFLKIPGAVNSAADPDGGDLKAGEAGHGGIGKPSDLDAFQFYGYGGDRVIINAVKTNGTLDTTIQLYPPGSGPVEAAGWMTGYGGDQLDHQLAKAGLYTIVIADYGLDHIGDFDISFVKIPSTLPPAISNAPPDSKPQQ